MNHHLKVSISVWLCLASVDVAAQSLCERPQIVSFKSGVATDARRILAEPNHQLRQARAHDLDGDGDDDLVVPNITYVPEGPWTGSGRDGLILINQGDNSFIPAPGDVPVTVHPSRMLFADFDGNGLVDIFISDNGWDGEPFPGWKNSLMLQTSQGWTDASDRLPSDPTGFTHSAAIGDIDNDGDIDIFAYNNGGDGNQSPYLMVNDGRANFSRVDQLIPAPPSIPDQYFEQLTWWGWAAFLEDMDGDGFTDLVIGESGGWRFESDRKSYVFWGDGTGIYDRERATALPKEATGAAGGVLDVVTAKAIDLNEDGRPDILFESYATEGLGGRITQVVMNFGDRRFVDQTAARLGEYAVSPNGEFSLNYQHFDFDGNGAKDLVPEIHGGDPSIVAWLNDGNGFFAPLFVSDNDDSKYRDAAGRTIYVSDGNSMKGVVVEWRGDLNNGVYQTDVALPSDIVLSDTGCTSDGIPSRVENSLFNMMELFRQRGPSRVKK